MSFQNPRVISERRVVGLSERAEIQEELVVVVGSDMECRWLLVGGLQLTLEAESKTSLVELL
jgi:hypothetical protein